MGLVEVGPHEATDLTPPQAGGQFRVEEVVPDRVLPDHLHEPLQLGVVEDLLGDSFLLGQGDAFSGIAGNQVRLHRRIQSFMQNAVDAADRSASQLVPVLGVLLLTPVLLKRPVQPPDVLCGDLSHRLVPQMWLDVSLDVPAVSLQSRGPHRWGGVLLQPAVQPFPQGHLAVLAQIHIPVLLDVLMEFFQ